jgi:hypothetical protein
MAFLSVSDIASSLPAGYDSSQAERILVKIESQLTRLGFVFTDPSPSSQKMSNRHGVTLFEINPVRNITGVIIKSFIDLTQSEVLILNQDYTLLEHSNLSGYTVQVETPRRRIKHPDYLEVTGKFGIYIDFDLTTLEVRLLRLAIIDLIRKLLDVYANQSMFNAGISESSTGKSSVKFDKSTYQEALNSLDITQDPDFSNSLSHFLNSDFGVYA